MDRIRIVGGNELHGTIPISGAKNAALIAVKILATSNDALMNRLEAYAHGLAVQVEEKNARLKASLL